MARNRRFGSTTTLAVLSFAALSSTASGQPAYTYTTIDYPGADYTAAYGINDVGQIVGTYLPPGPTANIHAFLLSGGTFTRIGNNSFPIYTSGISDSGTIIGYACTDYACIGVQSFSLKNGKFTTIAYPGASWTVVTGINKYDQIVGYYYFPESQSVNFLYQDGVFSPAPPIPSGGLAAAISDFNQLAGNVGPLEAYLLNPNGSLVTFDFPGSVQTYALGMNNLSEVVGDYKGSSDSSIYGYFWSGGTFTTIVPPTAAGFTEAYAINNSGAIVGGFTDATGTMHGFLAIPDKSPGPVCGVYDISGETSVTQGQINPIPPSAMLFSQTDTVTNNTSKAIPSAYLVLHGQPTATTSLVGNELVTHCFSPNGDYILPVGTILPGKQGGYDMVWSAPDSSISYIPIVLNGMPNR